MKMRFSYVFFIVFLSGTASVLCTPQINEENNNGTVVPPEAITKVYHLQTLFKANWYRAQHHCLQQNMRLAIILSAAENEQLKKQIAESGFTGDSYWMALNKLGSEEFYWFGSNKPLDPFTNWADKGIANGPCVQMTPRDELKWAVNLCEGEKFFVCESDASQSVNNVRAV